MLHLEIRSLRSLLAAAALAAPMTASLTAQTVDTLGGTSSAPSRANTGKANLFQVDTSVVLLDIEMWLDVPGPETLTFFVHRHHSRAGSYQLEFSLPVAVSGGGGPQWYSSGPIAVPMLCGNHYLIGASWPGTVTYHYVTASAGAPVSFGNWQTGRTPGNPPPNPYSVPSGTDVAQYHQRLTTVAVPSVACVGTGCSATPPLPRLVAAAAPTLGATAPLEIVAAAPNTLAAFALAIGPVLPVPTPIFGCDVWINLTGVATVVTFTNGSGEAQMGLAVPNNPAFSGVQVSSQAAIFTPSLSMTNALQLQI